MDVAGRWGEEETRGQGDKGTRGQGDKGTRGQGNKGTRRQGDKGNGEVVSRLAGIIHQSLKSRSLVNLKKQTVFRVDYQLVCQLRL